MSIDFRKTAAKALRSHLGGVQAPCHSHCRELIAAAWGRMTDVASYPARNPLQPFECARWRDDDNSMLHAEAIILDRERLFDRCIHLGYPNLLAVILQHVDSAVTEAARELNPSAPPRVFFRLQDFLAARTQGASWHVPSSMLIGTTLPGTGFFKHYPYAQLVAGSAPDMPTGYAPGSDDEFHHWHFPAMLRIGDQYWANLSPEVRRRFPDQCYSTEVVVTAVGARGVSFGDCIEPQAFPSPWAREEDEDDLDDEEGPDDMTPPPGSTCENHPDRPAEIDVEYGTLCEDCAEHYLSGFIRD